MIFQNKVFLGHSGQTLNWNVECDSLSVNDWDWAAARVAEKYGFITVEGIPRGGTPFEKALIKHISQTGYHLIVDDVFTTGKSMEEARSKFKIHVSAEGILGIVLFARAETPEWIEPIWRLW